MKKLPARYAAVLTPLLLTAIMTGIISGISTMRALGFAPEAFALWVQAWLLSWLVAFPLMTVLLPLAQKAVRLVVDVR